MVCLEDGSIVLTLQEFPILLLKITTNRSLGIPYRSKKQKKQQMSLLPHMLLSNCKIKGHENMWLNLSK